MNDELKEKINRALLETFGKQFPEIMIDVFWEVLGNMISEIPETISVTQVIDTIEEQATVIGLKIDSL